jgi:hypothetical protein
MRTPSPHVYKLCFQEENYPKTRGYVKIAYVDKTIKFFTNTKCRTFEIRGCRNCHLVSNCCIVPMRQEWCPHETVSHILWWKYSFTQEIKITAVYAWAYSHSREGFYAFRPNHIHLYAQPFFYALVAFLKKKWA